MKNNGFRLLLNLFLLAAGLTAVQSTWAMRCLSGPIATKKFNIDAATNNSHITPVAPITVTSFNSAANTLLWESPTYSSTFTCYDDAVMNQTEYAFLYVDDQAKQLALDFEKSNLIMGIRFNGQEYPITSSTNKIETGKQALSLQSSASKASQNCTLISKNDLLGFKRCADPQTINLTYSLYIKSRGTGSNFPATVKSYDVFQLDGVGGRNANGNFQEKVSNIQIKYVECIPVLTTQSVDLGRYYVYQDVNAILRKTPFSINVTTNGKDCAQYPFVGVFSSAYRVDDQTVTAIETGMKDVVGIRLYEAGNSTALKLNDRVDFGQSNNTQLRKNFEAGVLFLKKPTNAGKFTSVINYEVYFK